MLRKMFRSKKGQGLVEYGLIVAGVALICAASIAVFGHKTNDLISAVAGVLPGAHAGDNGPIFSGKLIETTESDTTGAQIGLNVDGTEGILANNGTGRLGNNVLGGTPADGFGGLVVE